MRSPAPCASGASWRRLLLRGPNFAGTFMEPTDPSDKAAKAAARPPRLRDLQGRFTSLQHLLQGSSGAGAAAQVRAAAEPAARPGLRALRAASTSAKSKSRSAPTSRAASRSSSLSEGGADAGGPGTTQWSRTKEQDALSFKTAKEQDEENPEVANVPRGKDDKDSHAEEHDISEGEGWTAEFDPTWDAEDDGWTAGLPAPEDQGDDADAGRLPLGGDGGWKEEEPSAPPGPSARGSEIPTQPASGAGAISGKQDASKEISTHGINDFQLLNGLDHEHEVIRSRSGKMMIFHPKIVRIGRNRKNERLV